MRKFGEITKEMESLYEKKNSDYGNSFRETIDEFGFLPGVAIINNKVKRLKKWAKGGDMCVSSESARDTLVDIANYCVMMAMAIDDASSEAAYIGEHYSNDGV